VFAPTPAQVAPFLDLLAEDTDEEATYTESPHTATTQPAAEVSVATSGLPNRMMTAFEVAEFVGCHEETVRRAYLRGLLVSQRFGVRSRRFHPTDVLDWIRRGAPSRIS
jgi:excisionase family DNA binding protein